MFSKKYFAVVHPIAVCTYTNVAVDNLMEGFVNAGLDPVRIGYGQFKFNLQEHSFQSKLEKHPLYPKYQVILEDLEELGKNLGRTQARIFERQGQKAPSSELSRRKIYRDMLRTKLSRLNSEKQAMHHQMQTEVLTNADVVRFSTFHAFGELTHAFRYALPASVPDLSR